MGILSKEMIAERARRWWTPARRRRQSRLVRRHWALHPELLGTRGPKRPEVVARADAALKSRWGDPEFARIMSAAMKVGWTPKARRRLSRAKMGRTLPDATRKRMSESALARWARQRSGVADTAPRSPDAGGPGGRS